MTVTSLPLSSQENLPMGVSRTFAGQNADALQRTAERGLFHDGLDDMSEPQSEWDELMLADAYNVTGVPGLGDALAVVYSGEKQTPYGTELRTGVVFACEANGNAGFTDQETQALGAVAMQRETYHVEDLAIVTADRWEAMKPRSLLVAAARQAILERAASAAA